MKIVVFNVNWLGDVLFSTVALQLIRQIYPAAYIAVIVAPRCYEVLQGSPYLDELIIYDEENNHKGLWGKLKFIAVLRRGKFNKAFLFHRSFTRALLIFLAAIPERIGYRRKKTAWLLTDAIDAPDITKLHRAEYYLYLAKQYAGYEGKIDFKPDFFMPQEACAGIARLLEKEGIGENDSLAVLNPGGNWPQKRWPKENFAVLAKRLTDDFGLKVVISGAQKDNALAGDIIELSGKPLVNLCGKMNLKGLAALIRRAGLVISNDSGPLHIAAALGAKAIGLFGPTSALITGPYRADNAAVIQKDVGCDIPCYEDDCAELSCMKAITVEEVLEKVKNG